MTRRLRIGADERAAIATHLGRVYPAEGCGLLLGRADRDEIAVAGILVAANVAADPLRRFEIDPAAILRCQRESRAAGHAIVGHFHSHPGGKAEPSATDRAEAREAGMVWLIAGTNEKGIADIQAYCRTAGQDFEKMEIVG